MQKQIEDLPLPLQSLFVEFKAEMDAEKASANDYATQPKAKDIEEDFEQLDSVLCEEDAEDYDEYDENTYDMSAVSPYMREAFGEFDNLP